MRFTTLALLFLASLSAVSAKGGPPAGKKGGGPSPGQRGGPKQHASPEVTAKIEALKAHVKEEKTNEDKKDEDTGGDKGKALAYAGDKGKALAHGSDKPDEEKKDNKGNSYGQLDLEKKELAELKEMDAVVKDIEALEDKKIREEKEKKEQEEKEEKDGNLRGKKAGETGKPPMPTDKLGDANYGKDMKEWTVAMKKYEKDHPKGKN